MYICVCNAVTEKQIHAAAQNGVSSLDQLKAETGCATGCGQCSEMAEQILQSKQPKVPFSLPVFDQPAFNPGFA